MVVSMPNSIDEREHPGQQVGQVVAAAGQLDRAAEQVAEDQQQHDRERDPEDRPPGLALPVLEVAQGDRPSCGAATAVAVIGRLLRRSGGCGQVEEDLVEGRPAQQYVVERRARPRRGRGRAEVSAAPPPASPASTVTWSQLRVGGAAERRARPGRGRSRRRAVTITRSPPSRPLSSDGVPSRDHPARAHHGDPVGQLVGLVEVLRGEQHRRAAPRPPRGCVCQTSLRARGSSPVVGSSRKRSRGRQDQARRRCPDAAACRRSRSRPCRSAASVRSNVASSSTARELASVLARSCRRPNITRFSPAVQHLVERGVTGRPGRWLPARRAGRGVRRGPRPGPLLRRGG